MSGQKGGTPEQLATHKAPHTSVLPILVSGALAVIVERVSVPESNATVATIWPFVGVDDRMRAQILHPPEPLRTLRTLERRLGGTVLGVGFVVSVGRGRFADCDDHQGQWVRFGGICVGYV